MKTVAYIQKDGSKWCIYSKTGKKMGCYDSKEDAEKRLQQIEYFKHKASTDMNLQSKGSIAGIKTGLVKDGKDHYPILTIDQARSAANRVIGLKQSPDWFDGPLPNLITMVKAAICDKYPGLVISTAMSVEQALSKITVKNPAENCERKVPGVKCPSLENTSGKEVESIIASIMDPADNFAYANELIKSLEKTMEENKQLLSILKKVSKNGITADEFNEMIGYVQMELVRELLFLKKMKKNESPKAISSEDNRLNCLLEKYKEGNK